MRRALPLLLILLASPAGAQSSSDGGDNGDGDDAFFGGGGDETPKSDLSEARLAAANDKLQLGGMMYFRSTLSLVDSPNVEDQRVSFPNIVEVYLDARPSERLRGFVQTRVLWDPSWISWLPVPLLDQLWLKFDIARSVYFTIGQQPVRWGATRIWNPVDVINSTFREPLTLFDARTGVPLVKMHVPVESLGWNFYLLGVMDQVTSIDKAGVAARGEFVFGPVELGVVGSYRKGVDPKVGLDLSAGVWEFDVTSEVGVRFVEADDFDPAIQLSAGLEYAINYGDDDVLYLGGEYFWNPDADPEAQQFYGNEHYGALFLSLPAPGRWDDTTFTFSVIGNVEQKNMVTRIDWSQRVLTYMSLQAWVMGHIGELGELRGSPQTPSLVSLGLNLRIQI